MIDPDYPNVILSFMYHDFKIQITVDKWQDEDFYTAWADYSLGSAVAVPYAINTKLAVRNAKRWVDRRIENSLPSNIN